MQDDLNIIRKFCADGWFKDVRVVELPDCGFPTTILLRFSVFSRAGGTGREPAPSITERTCVRVSAARPISILCHRNPYR